MNSSHVKKRKYMYSCYIRKHRVHSYDDKRYVIVLFMKMRVMDSENVIKLIVCLL